MERSCTTYYYAILLLGMALPAQAQQVYKCTDGGQVSYQSAPCVGSAAKVWDATPQTIDPAIARHNAMVSRQMDQRHRQLSRRSSGNGSGAIAASIGQARDQSACDRMRAARAAAFERLGTQRSFQQSRQWDDRVHDACK